MVEFGEVIILFLPGIFFYFKNYPGIEDTTKKSFIEFLALIRACAE